MGFRETLKKAVSGMKRKAHRSAATEKTSEASFSEG